MNTQLIPVDLIVRGDNDRTVFDEGELQSLAESIRQHGLAQPVTVRPVIIDGNGRYEIVAGERRTRAMRDILGWAHIPCIVRELDDQQASAVMLVENTARVDLDPIAEGRAYKARVADHGWNTAQIAATAGVSEGRVRDRLALLSLTADIQHLVASKQMPIGHALVIADAGLDANRQRIALKVFNSSASMPLLRFREIVNELLAQQLDESQMDMFVLEFKLVEQVKKEARVLRGKKARTGAPSRADLPPVRVRKDDGVGDILDRFIQDLIDAGHGDAAAVIGNVYNTLVAGNWVSVPAASLLAKTANEEATAEAGAHFVKE
jgi:ParB/RepB/Spo0J family partition protein